MAQWHIACQQQQYLEKHPEDSKEVKFSLVGKSKNLRENIPQWLEDHRWEQPARQALAWGAAELAPHTQSGAGPEDTRLHTHSALKFYPEEHHIGAKRFYGYTFGLHIGVLGGKKAP